MEQDHRLDLDRRDRDRRYSRSHSRDRERDRSSRDYRDATSRDRDREHWDYRDKEWDIDRELDRDRERDRERDRSYKHSDSYRRSYGRDDRDEIRKRPRTPPMHSPKVLHPVERRESPNRDLEVPKDERVIPEKDLEPAVKSPVCEKEVATSPINEESVTMDVEEFEPILSDEDILDDNDHFQDMDFDYTAYTNNDDIVKLFTPGSTDLQKYKTPNLFEIKDNLITISDALKTTVGILDDFFKSSITKYTINQFESMNAELKEEFVHLCEKMLQVFGNAEHYLAIVYIFQTSKTSSDKLEREIDSQIKYIVEHLIDWIQISLDFEMANAQEQPGYKIRHIKCGVRLAEYCCHSIEFIELLWKNNFEIHEVLLELYNKEYMALSIKLMILRALDEYLLKMPATERFIMGSRYEITSKCRETIKYNSHNIPSNNGYKTLVDLLRKNPSVRIKFALNSILKKLNLFELMHKLNSTIKKLQNDDVSADEITFIVKALDQILHNLQNGPFALSQPKRFLPVAAQFEIVRDNVKNVIIGFFENHQVLECLTLLLAHASTMNIPAIKLPIYEILRELLVFEEGLEYLSKNASVINVLMKSLLQSEEDLQFEQHETKSHQLGLNLAYKIQCLYHLEALRDLGSLHNYEPDVTEIFDQLHAIYCLSLNNVGKIACAEVLGFKTNFSCLLQFFDVLNSKEKDVNFTKFKKSPTIGYIVDLLHCTVTTVSNVAVLELYSKQLLHITSLQEVFEPSLLLKLQDIGAYLKPFENYPVKYDNISVIVENIQRALENITQFPLSLVSTLRILEHIGISRHSNKSAVLSENPLNNYSELKYKHVILQLFSLDGVCLLTKLLQSICEFYEQPNLYSSVFVSNLGLVIVNTVKPAVTLLKQMLTYVIQCRNTQFKDLTAVPILLQTYNLLRAYPHASMGYFMAQKVCRVIVETLLVYTQPVSDEVHEKDSLNKTLWTLMCGEVLKYTTTAPYTFMSGKKNILFCTIHQFCNICLKLIACIILGLLVFSELLPLPLPLQTREQLTKEEISWVINLRKLWSAHLHSHSNAIQDMINRMCTTTHAPLLNLLRRVCVQLSDLAANSAIMIARGVLDIVHEAVVPKEENKAITCTNHTARLLNFLACLVTHGTLKCAVMQLLNAAGTSVKGDEKYPVIMQSFMALLKANEATTSHIQSQECILSIIQSLCDCEITLYQNVSDGVRVSSEVFLANALPVKEQLLLYLTMILDHLAIDSSFVTHLPILRTFILLTEHNYGFYHLKDSLLKRTEPLLNVFAKLEKNFSKENTECLSALNTLLEFLRLCLTLDEIDENLLYKPRNTKMTLAEVKQVIGWKKPEGEARQTHCLCIIEDIVKVNRYVLTEGPSFYAYLLTILYKKSKIVLTVTLFHVIFIIIRRNSMRKTARLKPYMKVLQL